MDTEWFIPVLATWECVIGLGLLLGRGLRITLLLLGAHMVGTFLPLATCPEEVWTHFPYAWTLEGQYILKNLVLVGAGFVLVGSLRKRESVARAADNPNPESLLPGLLPRDSVGDSPRELRPTRTARGA